MLRWTVLGLDADFDTDVMDCIVCDFGPAKRILCTGRLGSEAPNCNKQTKVIIHFFFLFFTLFSKQRETIFVFEFFKRTKKKEIKATAAIAQNIARKQICVQWLGLVFLSK